MTGLRMPGERLPAGPSRRTSYGQVAAQDHLERIAGHSLRQARPQPVQRPPRQGRRGDRGAGRGHRAAHAAAEPHRAAGAGRERRRDRHVRGAGRRPALPGAGAAGEAEAPRPHRAGPLHHPHRRHRRGGQPRRERAAGAAASARPVPRVPGPAREGPVRGGHRRGVLRLGRRRAPAPAAGVGLAEAAGGLCRGRHVAGPADGVHGQSRPRAAGAGVGGAAARPRAGRRTRSAGCSRRTRCGPPTGGRGSSASPTTRPPAASCCATCSSPTTAAGCRTRPCSTGSSPRSWSGKQRPSAPRDGSGSRSPPTSPTATRTGCAGSAARRCR